LPITYIQFTSCAFVYINNMVSHYSNEIQFKKTTKHSEDMFIQIVKYSKTQGKKS